MEDIMYQVVIERLQKQLAELQAQTPIASATNYESFGAWENAFNTVERHKHDARITALFTAPKDVQQLVEQIEAQVSRLQNREARP